MSVPASVYSLPPTAVRMSLRTSALWMALTLGGAADVLLRVDGRPGLNVLLWAITGVAVLIALLQQRAVPPSREAALLVGGALAAAALLVLRDAEALAVFSVLAAVALLVLAAGHAASGWVHHATPSHAAFAAVRVGLLCVAGPFGWGRRAPDGATSHGGMRRTARTLVRGTVMATPALLLLAALLMSADPVFARFMQRLLFVDVEPFLERAVLVAVVAWGVSGYLRAMLVPDDTLMARLRIPQPALAAGEVTVALWLLNLLFTGFMLVQLRYLFGGADLITMTDGLTYADYARRGFFELVATAALVVPLLLLADWAAAPSSSRSRSVLRATMLLLVLLLVGVIASAAYRMRLYQAVYGLTELRLYVSVGIVALTAVLAWLTGTVLRGRRERFGVGVVVIAIASLVTLHLLNPHAVIARVNLARAVAGAEYDGAYVRVLSADAVPTLLAGMAQLPDPARCEVARHLAERWGGERVGGWRTWNASDARARRLMVGRRVTVGCPDPAVASAF